MARNVVDELVVRLTADASRLQAELGKAETNAKASGNRIGVSFAQAFKTAARFGTIAVAGLTAAGTALTLAARKAAEYADQIDKTAIRTRISRDALQELAFAADQAGVEFTAIEANVRAFTGRLSEAERGSATVTETFKRLGVALRDQNGALRDTESLFLDTLTALSNVENETQRAALAVQAFGEQGSALLPFLSQGAGGLDDLRAKARELGLVLSGESIAALVAYKDQLSVVQQQFGALGRDITTNFLPILTQGLLPALQDQVIPALRELVERAVGVADAFDESGQPTQDFKDRIDAIAAAVGGLVTNLVGLGEISVGLVQVVTAPFAALGNVLGQLSVGVPNFLDAYRRAFSGDFSGFRGRPIDTLVPNVDDILGVALEQANAGLAGVRAGASRIGSFVPGAPGSSAFVPSTRTSGTSNVGVGGLPGGAGAPAGTDTDPVVVAFSRTATPVLFAEQRLAAQQGAGGIPRDARANFPAISDRGARRGDGGLGIVLAGLESAEAALVESVRQAGATRRQAYTIDAQQTAAAAQQAAAAEAAANQAIADSVREAGNTRRQAATIQAQETAEAEAAANEALIDSVREAGRTRRQAYLQTAIAEGAAAREARAALLAGIGAGAVSDRGRTRGDGGLGAGTTPFGVITPPTAPAGVQAMIDARTNVAFDIALAASRAAAEQEAAAIAFKQSVVTAGVQFASDLAGAIKSGSPSGIFGALTGGIGSLVGISNPFAGGLISIIGGLFGGFLPDGRDSSDAARAAGARPNGAPAIELNLSVFQNLAVNSLTGGDRAAVDGLLDQTVSRIESVLVSFGQRLTAVEARTA